MRSPLFSRRLIPVLLLAGSLLLPLRGAPAYGADDAQLEALRDEVDRILDQGRFATATWGLLAISLDRGDTLLVRNPDLPLLPASTLKLLTSAAALHYLGDDYRYTTWLLSEAPVVDGVLEGDLILYGTGDPGLSDRFHPHRDAPFEALVEQLQAAGIREVRGRVLGDGTFFPGPLLADGWNQRDLNEWFTAPSGALSYNENVVSVRVRPSAPGSPPEIRTVPEHLGLLIANEARTVSGRARAPLWLLRDSPDQPIRAVGELSGSARDVWRQMTVHNPSLAAAHGLTHVMRDQEILVRGYPSSVPTREESPVSSRRVWGPGDSLRVLATFRSPPLSDYLRAVNQRSHNLYADLLLKTLGQTRGEEGSFLGGGAVLKDFLVREVGVPEDQVSVTDGSGLSALNRVSPGVLVATLRHMNASPHWETLRETLPVAGSRELARRMTRTAASGNLRAKTGTLDRVSSLTGVVTTASGEQVAFAIVGNDLPSAAGAKRLEDRIGAALADWSRF